MFDSINANVDAAFDNVLDFVLGPVSEEPVKDTDLEQRRHDAWLRTATPRLRYTLLVLLVAGLLRVVTWPYLDYNMEPTRAVAMSVYLSMSTWIVILVTDQQAILMCCKLTCFMTPACMTGFKIPEVYYRSTVGVCLARLVMLLCFTSAPCSDVVTFLAPQSVAFVWWHVWTQRGAATPWLTPAQVVGMAAGGFTLQVAAVLATNARRRRWFRRPAKRQHRGSDSSTSDGEESNIKPHWGSRALRSRVWITFVFPALLFLVVFFVPELSVFHVEQAGKTRTMTFRPWVSAFARTVRWLMNQSHILMFNICGFFALQYYVMTSRRKERYTPRGEAAKRREARVAKEVRYFLTFICVPILCVVTIGKLWEPDVYTAPWWRMMAGRGAIFAMAWWSIRVMKRDPTLFAVNFVAVVRIPTFTAHYIYLENGAAAHGGEATTRITLLRAVVVFYIHSRPVKILQ